MRLSLIKTIHRLALPILFIIQTPFGMSLALAEPLQPKLAVILNSADASVSLIDMNTRQVVKTVPVGKEPHHLMMTPDQKILMIANAAGNDVVLMDPTSGEITGRIPHIIDPYQVGYSPNHKWFVANGNRLNRVDVYAADSANLTLAKSFK